MSGADGRGHGYAADTCLVELRANDFDWTGHLNNSIHPQLIETGRWRWSRSNGVDLRDSDLAAVVVSLHLDYLNPITWNPLGCVVVRTDLVETTPYSFTLAQDIEDPDGRVLTRGRVRLAMVSRTTAQVSRVDLAAWRAKGRVP